MLSCVKEKSPSKISRLVQSILLNVTEDRQKLIATIFNSIGFGVAIVLLILIAIAWQIRRELSPLDRMNHSIKELNLDRLQAYNYSYPIPRRRLKL